MRFKIDPEAESLQGFVKESVGKAGQKNEMLKHVNEVKTVQHCVVFGHHNMVIFTILSLTASSPHSAFRCMHVVIQHR